MFFTSMQFKFEAAHRLQNHPRACKFLHGHSYVVEVVLVAKDLDAQGMVMDFSNAKKIIWEDVLKIYDHCTILELGDPLIGLLDSADQRVMVYNNAPTAEYMALFIGGGLEDAFTGTGVRLCEVTVWETATNSATWSNTKL